MFPCQTGEELEDNTTNQFAIWIPISSSLSRVGLCVSLCVFGTCINSRWYYSLARSQKVASELMCQYLHYEHTAGFKGKWTNPTSFPFFSMFKELWCAEGNRPEFISSLLIQLIAVGKGNRSDHRILLNFLLKQTLSRFCCQLYTHRSSLTMHVFKRNTSPSWLKNIKTVKGRRNIK